MVDETNRGTTNPTRMAKTIECVNPRCPHMCPYGIPTKNPTTSTSGNRQHTTEKLHRRQAEMGSLNVLPSAYATATCPNADATTFPLFQFSCYHEHINDFTRTNMLPFCHYAFRVDKDHRMYGSSPFHVRPEKVPLQWSDACRLAQGKDALISWRALFERSELVRPPRASVRPL